MNRAGHRLPDGWAFSSLRDVGLYCAHPPQSVRVIGNVERKTLWRCDLCHHEVIPVAPGWVYDRRRGEHVHPVSREAARAAGHPNQYLPVA